MPARRQRSSRSRRLCPAGGKVPGWLATPALAREQEQGGPGPGKQAVENITQQIFKEPDPHFSAAERPPRPGAHCTPAPEPTAAWLSPGAGGARESGGRARDPSLSPSSL